MPPGVLYNAIAETRSCLPDAIQLLTPCTVGNGWLKIVHLGHFALSLYDKSTGEGVRIGIDYNRLAHYNEIRSWFFKLKPKIEQDEDKLMEEIRALVHGFSGQARYPLMQRIWYCRKRRASSFAPLAVRLTRLNMALHAWCVRVKDLTRGGHVESSTGCNHTRTRPTRKKTTGIGTFCHRARRD